MRNEMATATTKLDSLIAAENARVRAAQPALATKCPHGVWIPEGERASAKSGYCTGCYPSGVPFRTRLVVLPHQRGGENKANRRTPEQCPECGSFAHVELNKSLWACADCDTKFRAPRRRGRPRNATCCDTPDSRWN